MMNLFGSQQNMMSQVRQFMGNPMQYMMQRKLNIPAELQNNPQGMIQHLMNNGTMSQQQYNQLQQMARQMQSNPQFMQMFQK